METKTYSYTGYLRNLFCIINPRKEQEILSVNTSHTIAYNQMLWGVISILRVTDVVEPINLYLQKTAARYKLQVTWTTSKLRGETSLKIFEYRRRLERLTTPLPSTFDYKMIIKEFKLLNDLSETVDFQIKSIDDRRYTASLNLSVHFDKAESRHDEYLDFDAFKQQLNPIMHSEKIKSDIENIFKCNASYFNLKDLTPNWVEKSIEQQTDKYRLHKAIYYTIRACGFLLLGHKNEAYKLEPEFLFNPLMLTNTHKPMLELYLFILIATKHSYYLDELAEYDDIKMNFKQFFELRELQHDPYYNCDFSDIQPYIHISNIFYRMINYENYIF